MDAVGCWFLCLLSAGWGLFFAGMGVTLAAMIVNDVAVAYVGLGIVGVSFLPWCCIGMRICYVQCCVPWP